MSLTDLSQRYATVSYPTDGVTTLWEISFQGGYINEDYIHAYSVAVDPETGLETDRTEHALVVVDPGHVSITPAVPDNRVVRIFRDTPKVSPLVQFTNGRILNKANIDLANRQAIHAIAEIVDNLVANRIQVDQQTGVVIDTVAIIREIHEQVIALLAASGIVSVTPRLWTFLGDGEQTHFEMEGADIFNPGFYDTYVSGLGVVPGVAYNIIEPTDDTETQMAFIEPLPDGAVAFAVLRGYARPYTGPPPVTDIRTPIRGTSGTSYFVTVADQFALILCSSNEPVTVTISDILAPGSVSEMRDGSYFSVVQIGTGAVTLAPDSGELIVPEGCLPQTRARGTTISATCTSAESNTWLITGDLAQEV